MYPARVLILALVMLLFAGPSAAPALATDPQAAGGRLVIVGGWLDPSNEAIYRAFLKGLVPAARVGVVPLASGVPERSGPLTVEDIQQYASVPENIINTELTNNNPGFAATEDCAQRLRGCAALWFTGGDQSRIIAALRPVAGDTGSYHAVRDVLADGGTVGGTSAGAAMMSTRMIRGGNSPDAMLLGVTDIVDGPGVCVGSGMGLFPYGVVDQHFLRRGRFGRLLVVTEASDARVGFGVSENRAMVVDLATHTIRVIGSQGLTLIDMRKVSRQGHQINNARISLLAHDDRIDGQTYAVTIAKDKLALSQDRVDTGAAIRFHDMWAPYVVAEMIKALAANPAQPVLSQDQGFEYIMTADKSTRFFTDPGGGSGLSAVGVRLDVIPRDGIEKLIAKRRNELAEASAE